MAIHPTEAIIEDIRQGRMVIVMDDEGRENEGDLIMAASIARAEDINFMARYGRGLICLTLTKERCEQLQLPLMVRDTYYRQTTNFTVSIEAARGVTTGISAADRARDDPHRSGPGGQARRPGAARPRIPADGPAGRGSDARRTHRGRL